MTGGMDNPVDLVFTPGGERIFDTTFFQFPGNGQRDGLVHAVYGGIYGKDWDVIHEPAHKWTGPAVMPVLTHLGPAAPAGLHRYESRGFGADYQDNLFAALFNLQKVTRHVLEPTGATFRTRDSDFLVSNNKDFHPTDVIEDADGSLLIIDTGGWYKLCCPTSQLVKPDVLGAIYRVRKKGAAKLDDPRGQAVDWAQRDAREIAAFFDDPRPVVRRRAVETLAKRGATALAAIDDALQRSSAEARRNGVWCATRIDDPGARTLARRTLADRDASVRQTALHSISVWRDRDATAQLIAMLQNASPHNQRAAAEALGRIGDRAAVPALLAAGGAADDRVLQHSLTYALIEIDDFSGTAAGLKSAHPRTRRVALIALDQMQGTTLTATTVTEYLAAADPKLKQAAWWVASRHPEWGAELSAALRERLSAKGMPSAERDELVQQLAQLAKSPAIQTLLADRLGDGTASPEARRLTLQAMARASLKEAPPPWIAALTQSLAATDAELLAEAVTTARALRLPKQVAPPFGAALVKLGSNPDATAAIRVGAWRPSQAA